MLSAVPVGKRIALTLFIGVAALMLAARPSAVPSPTPTPVPSPTPVAVKISGFGFTPQTLQINPGQFVQWTNVDSVQQTATAADGSWDTGPIDPKKTGMLQFFQLGKFDYLSGFNPMLRATVLVVRATPSPSPTPAASGSPPAG